MSNSLGTVNDVRRVAEAAHAVGATVVVDGAQAAAHLPLDVAALGADFYAFSGHKVYGPTGAGVLWGRRALLEAMPPWQGGGEMIASVSLTEGTAYAEIPHKLEAGTPDIAGVLGLGAALDWLEQLGPGLGAHEGALLAAATEAVGALEGVRLVGTAPEKAAVLSFVIDGVHPHDAGTVLDTAGVAVRTGHHCTEPVMERFDIPATIRASFGAYNTMDDVERLVAGLKRVREVLVRRP
jgi:cysteine desulfurase/selenocysteine lyase